MGLVKQAVANHPLLGQRVAIHCHEDPKQVFLRRGGEAPQYLHLVSKDNSTVVLLHVNHKGEGKSRHQ